MDTIECIHTRRSVRKYREMHVQKDDVGKIIDAGRQAPSSGNLQNWRFIYVMEKSTLQGLAEASYDQMWMTSAPVHIVVCAEPAKIVSFYGTRGEHLYSVQNCAACVQNMLLAAHAMGMAGCWVGAFDETKVRNLLGIPDEVRVQAIVTIGYPSEKPSAPNQYKLHEQLFLEKWGARLADSQWASRDYAWSIENRLIKKGKELKENGPQLLEKGKDILSKVSEKLSSKRRSQKDKEKN